MMEMNSIHHLYLFVNPNQDGGGQGGHLSLALPEAVAETEPRKPLLGSRDQAPGSRHHPGSSCLDPITESQVEVMWWAMEWDREPSFSPESIRTLDF